jgi:hypothetical protein
MPGTNPLRLRREALGLSLRVLGQRCQIPFAKLHFYEHGLEIPPKHAIAIAEILKCSPTDLEVRDDR